MKKKKEASGKPLEFCLCFCIVTYRIIITTGAVKIFRIIYCASFIFTNILKNA